MTTTQQTTAANLVATYGAIVKSFEADRGRVIVQYALGASVVINADGTHIG